MIQIIQLNQFLSNNLTCSIPNRSSPLSKPLLSSSFSLHCCPISTQPQLVISPSVFDILVHKHHFPPELASRVASESRFLKNSDRVDSVVSFLREKGFSNAQVVKIVRNRPGVLAACVADRIEPRIKILRDLGISSHVVTRIISSTPAILQLSMKNNIVPSLSVLKGLLESDNEVGRVISRYPRLLTVNFENTVVPNVEFLKSCGVTMHRIRSVLTNLPNFFTIKPELVRKAAEKGELMGIDASSKSYIYAVLYIALLRNEVLELKLQTLRELGVSDSDIVTMLNRAPLVLSISVEKIKKVKELLLATGKFDLSSIVGFPTSLAHSIEKRYIPRLGILGILESRNLIEVWPSLATICRLTDAEFFEKFISPYLGEISDVYISKSSSEGKGRNEIAVTR